LSLKKGQEEMKECLQIIDKIDIPKQVMIYKVSCIGYMGRAMERWSHK
jgi:hypothetical protein